MIRRLEQVCFGRTLTELPQNQLPWNPRTADHRLAEHHARIHFDSIRDRHWHLASNLARPAQLRDGVAPAGKQVSEPATLGLEGGWGASVETSRRRGGCLLILVERFGAVGAARSVGCLWKVEALAATFSLHPLGR